MTALDIEKTIARLQQGHLEAVLKATKKAPERIVPIEAGHVDTLTRATLTAAPGNVLCVWDFSQVEARALAWAAQDHDALARFAVYDSGDHTNGDPYAAMAAKIFGGVPGDYVKGSAGEYPGRHIGKQAELGCFGADTQVLTRHGFKAITAVCASDQLWDGIEWVTHCGVVAQGWRQTQPLAGVHVTPDHQVYLGAGEWSTAAHLAHDGNTLRRALAIASDLWGLWVLSVGRAEGWSEIESSCSATAGQHPTRSMYTTCGAADPPAATDAPSGRVATQPNTTGATPTSCRTTSIGAGCSTGSRQSCNAARTRETGTTRTTVGAGFASTSLGGKTASRFCSTWRRFLVGTSLIWTWIAATIRGGTSRGTFASLPAPSTKPTSAASARCSARSIRYEPVYDIAHAGARNRYTILTDCGPLIVHNCGYGMGVEKFHRKVIDDGGAWEPIIAAAGLHCTPEEMAEIVVHAWRELHAPIVCFWRELQDGAVQVTQGEPGISCPVGPFTWHNIDGLICCELPSGRLLCYRGMRCDFEESKFGGRPRPSLSYLGRKGRERTYGGKLTENVTQACCRDLMAEALIKAEECGLNPSHTIHDEILCDVPAEFAAEADALMGEIMTTCPSWCPNMPLAAEGLPVSLRYGK